MNTNVQGCIPGDVRVRQPDRTQMALVAQCPDDLIPKDHPARTIWQVTGNLDLTRFYEPIKAVAGVVGRDATDPRMLLALWVYAATDGVGSARELDKLCKESNPYQWLCGGVSVNYHTLADFRVKHGQALDELMTQIIASLVNQKLVTVHRISQDGTRVRACAGASSFRRKERLEMLLKEAGQHVQQLREQMDDPEQSAGLSARKKAAMERAARERQERVRRAIDQLPALEKKQKKLKKKLTAKQKKELEEKKQPRASTTDDEARRMKMANGGFGPGVNVQLAVDPESRAIVGVDVVNSGVDTDLDEPMRRQVEQRAGQKVEEHLLDGGYVKFANIDKAAVDGVTVFAPVKPQRNQEKRANRFEPLPTDSQAVADWRRRMGSESGQAIYKERGSTVETVNADLKSFRGLVQLTVRGLKKARCVALISVLAYNLMHFGQFLVG